jgi:hypothetical protein
MPGELIKEYKIYALKEGKPSQLMIHKKGNIHRYVKHSFG